MNVFIGMISVICLTLGFFALLIFRVEVGNLIDALAEKIRRG